MVDIKKILYPLDFSECSYAVLPWVLALVEKFQAEVYLLYVARDLRYFAGFHVPHTSITGFVKEVGEAAEKMLDEVCEEHLHGCPIFQRQVVVGEPGEEIVRAVDREKVDLVIMGTHGRKGIDRTLFGSVAEYVVKNSSVPVLTINPFKKAKQTS
ncbi:MAG: universal stress protein [Deltaproteobacteria bacterium]|nr:universal stress protein [Deltaproteobacteria bacterium]MBW2071271.1 universal stress protein [Deltaproteobacteria bacterium]